MHKALLLTESKDAKNIAKSLDIDNLNRENLKVSTKLFKGRIRTKVKADKISTLLSTLDDIIRCQIIAEKNIKNGNC
ncbi:MAG: KEOPS complex subunit Pcc1 [Candidatus Altiarchaeota archaeon]